MGVNPVIMCGGSGVRLWPASRPSRPKQFIRLIGDRSIFQRTVLRVAGITGAGAPLIVAGVGHAAAIRAQLAEIGVTADLLLEPEARDSAAAMGAAAAWVSARDPDGVLVVVASDHHIPDDAAFCAAVDVAVATAAAGQRQIVTLGVRPAGPSTAYGYIQAGEAPGAVKPVAAFVEKPNHETAVAYLASGYLWNSGNFIVRADRLLEELAAHAPLVLGAVIQGVADADGEGRLGDAFRAAPKISIDFAVMENTRHAGVLPVDFAWSDLGAWDAILPASDRDDDGNSTLGEVRLHGASNVLVRNDGGPLVVGIGVSNLAIIAEHDAVLVCDLSSAQGVKAAVEALKAEGVRAADITHETLPQIAARLKHWLELSVLPLWATIGLDPAGGFHEAIDQEGVPARLDRRARVQPRQAYVYARAGKAGWPGPWRAAAEAGMAYLESTYRRPDGLFRTLTGPDGAVVDDSFVVYDQAFAMLAWSELGEEAKALDLLSRLQVARCPAGGYVEVTADERYQSNPHMHLFEAALAWVEAGGDPRWEVLAREIVGLALTKFIDPQTGAIREFFQADWSHGHRIEPGHQFEWAWLLARWARLKADPVTHAAALRLFDNGLAGIDLVRGVAVDAMGETRARLWPQTEWLKAALILGSHDEALRAARAFDAYLAAPVAGLWRDKMLADGAFVEEVAPASSLYHIAVAVAELGASLD